MSDEITIRKPGRPPGSGFRQEIYDKYVKPQSEKMVKQGLALAFAGEPTILKFFLERMIPKNPMPTGMDLSGMPKEQLQKILLYIMGGDIPVDDALKMSTIVKESVLLDRVDILTAKLEKLEQWIVDRANGVTLEHKDNGREKELDQGSD